MDLFWEGGNREGCPSSYKRRIFSAFSGFFDFFQVFGFYAVFMLFLFVFLFYQQTYNFFIFSRFYIVVRILTLDRGVSFLSVFSFLR